MKADLAEQQVACLKESLQAAKKKRKAAEESAAAASSAHRLAVQERDLAGQKADLAEQQVACLKERWVRASPSCDVEVLCETWVRAVTMAKGEHFSSSSAAALAAAPWRTVLLDATENLRLVRKEWRAAIKAYDVVIRNRESLAVRTEHCRRVGRTSLALKKAKLDAGLCEDYVEEDEVADPDELAPAPPGAGSEESAAAASSTHWLEAKFRAGQSVHQGLVALRTPRAPLGPPPQMLLDSIGLRSKASSPPPRLRSSTPSSSLPPRRRFQGSGG